MNGLQRSRFVSFTLGCFAWCLPLALPNRGFAQPQNDLQAVTLNGKIESGEGNQIIVADEKGVKKAVTLPSEADRISFTGKALPVWIQPEMFVRFTSKVDSNGKIELAPTEVVIFQPARRRRAQTMEEMQKNVPGMYPAGAAKGTNLVGGNADPNVAQEFNIVGVVAGMEKEVLGVQAGPFFLKVPVSEKTVFSVLANSMELAKPGDTVAIKGLSSPKSPDEVQAQNVAVTAAEPLGTEPPDDAKAKPKKGNAKSNKKTQKPKRQAPPNQFDYGDSGF